VGVHTGAIYVIEQEILGIVGVGSGGGLLIAGAISSAGAAVVKADNAYSKAEEVITKANNTSNFIIDTSNVISTRITNLSSGSVPTVANVFPLLYGSHFEQISDGLSPDKISIKNINSSGRFDYDFLKVPPTAPFDTIVNIVEPTSSPSVAITTINTDYKYMAFTCTSGATNTLYTTTFNKETECDILVVGGGGGGGTSYSTTSAAPAGGGGAGGLIFLENQTVPAGTYNILVGKGGSGDIFNNTTAPLLAKQGNNSFFSYDSTDAVGGGGGVSRDGNENGGNGGSGGGSGWGNPAGSANGGTGGSGQGFAGGS